MSSILRDDKYCTILEEENMFSDVCTNDREKLWVYGTVPYVFDDDVSDELKSFVMEAMKRIIRESVVEFVKRTNQMDYIKIIDGGKFCSYVGRIGGKQKLWVTKDEPNTVGRVMHELLHALGFYHEHCRYDRDKYVEVTSENRNYKQLKSGTICHGPYDFESIMHYPLGSKMALKKETNAKIGQREKLSDGDINALNELYPSTLKNAQTLSLDILNGTDGPLNVESSDGATLSSLYDPYPLDLYMTSNQEVNFRIGQRQRSSNGDLYASNKPKGL